MSFVHLYGHSTYSLLESIGSIGDILWRIKDLGMKHVGIVDYNWMYGAVKFFQKAKDYNINPLIGVELSFVMQWSAQKVSWLWHTLCFLAKNYDWYRALLKLVSIAFERDVDNPRIELNDLALVQDNVYVFVGWIRWWVFDQLWRRIDHAKIADGLAMIKDIVWSTDILFAISVQDYTVFPKLQEANDFLLWLATSWWVTCFAASNFHYPTMDHKYAAEVALAIKDGKKMYEDDRRKIIWDYHIMSEEEMMAKMQSNWMDDDLIDTLLLNTWKIADTIKIDIPLWQSLFPNYESSEEIVWLYAKYKDGLVE
jgi:DNA polymerase-3 subunit alpha